MFKNLIDFFETICPIIIIWSLPASFASSIPLFFSHTGKTVYFFLIINISLTFMSLGFFFLMSTLNIKQEKKSSLFNFGNSTLGICFSIMILLGLYTASLLFYASMYKISIIVGLFIALMIIMLFATILIKISKNENYTY